jgi:hypothetical protein
MRIFDTVIISEAAELDLLEARFEEYRDIPEVTHVICEAPVTYSGDPKPMHFRDSRLSGEWLGKWNHVRTEAHELPSQGPRIRKDALREQLAHGINGDPQDLVMHGNPDEIPAEWAVQELALGNIGVPVTFRMRWCAYAPSLVHPHPWKGTSVTELRYLGSLSGLREKKDSYPAVLDAGTRLSMLGMHPETRSGGDLMAETAYHPDGHALWRVQVNDTWPRWICEREGT